MGVFNMIESFTGHGVRDGTAGSRWYHQDALYVGEQPDGRIALCKGRFTMPIVSADGDLDVILTGAGQRTWALYRRALSKYTPENTHINAPTYSTYFAPNPDLAHDSENERCVLAFFHVIGGFPAPSWNQALIPARPPPRMQPQRYNLPWEPYPGYNINDLFDLNTLGMSPTQADVVDSSTEIGMVHDLSSYAVPTSPQMQFSSSSTTTFATFDFGDPPSSDAGSPASDTVINSGRYQCDVCGRRHPIHLVWVVLYLFADDVNSNKAYQSIEHLRRHWQPDSKRYKSCSHLRPKTSPGMKSHANNDI
ncbi:16169_t:CDS:2, partial [Acaulospora colombiana]